MSPKTLIIAAAALAASTAATLPASAAPVQADQTQTRPLPFRATIMFNLIDRNADGAVDADELSVLQKAIFTAIDTDKDGKLSQDEFKKIADGVGAGGSRHPGQFGRGPGMDGRGMHHGPDGNRQGQMEDGPDGQMMPRLGDNEGGQPSQGMGQPRDFASLDTNGDGVVSADEFAAGAPGFPGMPLTR